MLKMDIFIIYHRLLKWVLLNKGKEVLALLFTSERWREMHIVHPHFLYEICSWKWQYVEEEDGLWSQKMRGFEPVLPLRGE